MTKRFSSSSGWFCRSCFSLFRNPNYLTIYCLIFPALAILTAATLVRLYRQSESKLRFALALGWLMQILNTVYLAAGTIFPSILPSHVRESVNGLASFIWFYVLFSVLMLGYMIISRADGAERQRTLFLVHGLSMCVFLVFLTRMVIAIAPTRSAQALAEQVRSQLTTTTQVVFYDTYLAGMPFYLQTERPIWLLPIPTRDALFWEIILR